MAGLLPLVIARGRHLSWLVLFVVGGIALFHASTFPWSQAPMDQTLLTACVLGPLPVVLIAYLLRHRLPRTARGVGWSSGAVASTPSEQVGCWGCALQTWTSIEPVGNS